MNMENNFRYDFSGKWFKGNLHMHTTRSDGRLTVKEASRFYSERGYDFIAITDHMTPFKRNEIEDDLSLLVLNGIELNGKDDQDSFYHVVCIGNVEGISEDMELMEAMKIARSQGNILIWAHPHWS